VTSEDITPPARFEETPEQARMSLMEHLQELRTRLIPRILSRSESVSRLRTYSRTVVPGADLADSRGLRGKVMLIGTGVGEAFYTKIKVALIAGLFVASPAFFTKSGNSSPRDCTRRSARWRSRSLFFCDGFFLRSADILLGGSFQDWLCIFSISIREHRSHAHDSDKRVPVVLGQAAPGVCADLRDADLRVLFHQAWA